MQQLWAKLKNPIVLGFVIVILLLVAGAAYLTVTVMNQNATKSTKSSGKPKIAAPSAVQNTLKTVNDSAQKAYNLHTSAKAAVNETQVKLAE